MASAQCRLSFPTPLLPHVDTYSFGAAGAQWLNHEWLSEIPFFFGFKAMGLQGILAVYFSVLVLIYLGVYYRSCRSGADCKNATIATLLAIFLGVVSIGPRTLLFGWLCMWDCFWCWTVSSEREGAFGCCRRCLRCGSTFTDHGSLEW